MNSAAYGNVFFSYLGNYNFFFSRLSFVKLKNYLTLAKFTLNIYFYV